MSDHETSESLARAVDHLLRDDSDPPKRHGTWHVTKKQWLRRHGLPANTDLAQLVAQRFPGLANLPAFPVDNDDPVVDISSTVDTPGFE